MPEINVPIAEVRADFDRLAPLDDGGWDHNSHYHEYLLRFLPVGRAAALDAGCGTGTFSLALSRHFARVLAIDFSPEMLSRARSRSRGIANIEYLQTDFTTYGMPAESFDCVASIATLHHLSLEESFAKFSAALRPCGVLLILDLYEPAVATDWMLHVAGIPASVFLELLKHGRVRQPAAVREAWAEHARLDTYSTIATLRSTAARLLPGARIRRHLLWRYSLVWQKPA